MGCQAALLHPPHLFMWTTPWWSLLVSWCGDARRKKYLKNVTGISSLVLLSFLLLSQIPWQTHLAGRWLFGLKGHTPSLREVKAGTWGKKPWSTAEPITADCGSHDWCGSQLIAGHMADAGHTGSCLASRLLESFAQRRMCSQWVDSSHTIKNLDGPTY